MEKATRYWFVAAAGICGVFALAGWTVVIYAFVIAPNTHKMTLPFNGVGVSPHDEASLLFYLPAFQTVVFLMTLYPNIRWKKIIARVADRVAPNDIWEWGNGKFPTVARVWCAGLCVLSGLNLYLVIQRVSALLQQF
jgi:hypothetical protein